MDINNVKNQRLLTRWIIWGLSSIIFLCVVSLVYIMTVLKRPEVAQVRKIPTNAVWVGGRAGGSWVELIESKNERDFHLKIYEDTTGNLEVDNWFRISDNCGDRPPESAKFYDTVEGYDGNQVHIVPTDGRQYCFLRPVDRALSSNTIIYYRINRRRVTQLEFERMRATLEISEAFTEGETEKSATGKRRAPGYVHIREARDPSSGRKYQYSIESFESETTYAITVVPK